MTELDRVRKMITATTGIDLDRPGQETTLRRCAERRIQMLGIASVEEYAQGLLDVGHPEVRWLLNAMTVGHTWFYRDATQMEVIAKLLTDELTPQSAPMNVWVPACATGEDVYTVAMLAAQARRPVSILGTDINTRFLERAAVGEYDPYALRELPQGMRGYFAATPGGRWGVAAGLKRSVRFEHHNLMGPCLTPPSGGGWQMILCRNAIIYFSTPIAQATVHKLARALAPEGRLLLGASELIHTIPPDLRIEEILGRVLLRRCDPRAVTPRPVRPRADPVPLTSDLLPPPPRATPASSAPREPAKGTLASGAALLVRGDLDSAIETYLRLLESEPLGIEPRMLLGIAYHLRGQGAQAINALRAALFLDPDLWPAAFYLAVTYEQLGQVPQAQREYRRVLDASTRARPLNGSAAHDDLERWKNEMVEIARRRAR